MKVSSYVNIMTFWFSLVSGNKICKKHVYNSITPKKDTEPSYNISVWVKQLHLQQCTIVEIGEKYCGLFVEYRPTETEGHTRIEEYFLGLCDLATLRKWKFCPPAVENERPKECIFQEDSEVTNQPARVHRRLCDVTGLATYGKACNCSSTVFHGQKLYEVAGFPTCFVPPLPHSVCLFGNVCGVFNCKAYTINKVHTVRCSPRCPGHQPFCEATGPDSSHPSKIYSYWTDWTEPYCDGASCNNTDAVRHSQALCINKNTGMGAVDCLGPGTNCCPPNAEMCKCYIYEEDGILKLSRTTKLKSTVVYELQQNYVASQYGGVKRYPRDMIINGFPKNKQRKHVLKEIYIPRQVSEDEEEEVDDAKDLEDDNDEDIVLEESEQENIQHTTIDLEKGDKKNIKDLPKLPNQIVMEEMQADLNQTILDEKKSKAIRLTIFLLNYQLFLLIITIILGV